MRTDIERIKNGEKPMILQNAMDIKDIAVAMNGASELGMSNEGIAAYYAIEGAEEWGINETNLEPHLDALRDAGAEFDYSKAMQIALEAAK